MEGIKFGFNSSWFLHVLRRAIARYVPLLLGVICLVASVPSHAQPVVIEASSWVAALERISCLRVTKTPDGNWLISGTFFINGEHFSDPTIRDAAFAELFRRKCATGGGGSSDTNISRSGAQTGTNATDYGPSFHGSVDAVGFDSHTGGGGSNAGIGSSTTSMFSETTIPPSVVSQIEPAVAVPSPITGAGLPGLIAACGALIIFARTRCKKIAG